MTASSSPVLAILCQHEDAAEQRMRYPNQRMAREEVGVLDDVLDRVDLRDRALPDGEGLEHLSGGMPADPALDGLIELVHMRQPALVTDEPGLGEVVHAAAEPHHPLRDALGAGRQGEPFA